MCILSHAIPGTGDATSFQMILPQKQVGRRSDIYVFCCSYTHNVAPKNKWIAFVSTTVETTSPAEELKAGLSLLGHIDEKFVEVVDVFEPLDDGKTYVFFNYRSMQFLNFFFCCVNEPVHMVYRDKIYISKGYDATSHFESEIDDVLDMYERITGKTLDLEKEDLAKRQEQH
jgi:Rab GDP dissociation inhibitor